MVSATGAGVVPAPTPAGVAAGAGFRDDVLTKSVPVKTAVSLVPLIIGLPARSWIWIPAVKMYLEFSFGRPWLGDGFIGGVHRSRVALLMASTVPRKSSLIVKAFSGLSAGNLIPSEKTTRTVSPNTAAALTTFGATLSMAAGVVAAAPVADGVALASLL